MFNLIRRRFASWIHSSKKQQKSYVRIYKNNHRALSSSFNLIEKFSCRKFCASLSKYFINDGSVAAWVYDISLQQQNTDIITADILLDFLTQVVSSNFAQQVVSFDLVPLNFRRRWRLHQTTILKNMNVAHSDLLNFMRGFYVQKVLK